MRKFQLFLLVIVFAALPLFGAETPGSVIFVKAASAAEDASADVFSQALPDGKPQLLLGHQALPAGFAGRLEQATPSADGAFLLLREGIGVVIRNKVTGKSRTVLGNGFSFSPTTEEVSRHINGGYWLWERANGGKIRRLSPADVRPLAWSPCGHTLLARIDHENPLSITLLLLDPRTWETRYLQRVNNAGVIVWAPDGAAIINSVQPDAKMNRVVSTSLTGVSRQLFFWPHSISALAVSPDVQHLALADTTGISILNSDGRVVQTISDIHYNAQQTAISLSFSPASDMLAVFTDKNYGEPHIFQHEELWVANVASGKATKLGKWDETLSGEPGQSTLRRLIGWLPGAPALLLAGHNGSITDLSSNWQKLWRVPITPDQPSTLLFDSGPLVIDMEWWAGRYENGK